MKLNKTFIPYCSLLIFVLLGFWQVAFLQHSLKWDAIDVVFPFRFYFSECIQSGHFPFWNPYQQTGTPFFADLQVPVFYPELLFTSLFTGYSIYTMNILFVIYVFISAMGMYKLSFYLNKNVHASIIAAIAYSFSGYVIGHGQHFFLLVGTAWIPFVIVNYLKLNNQKNFIDLLKTAAFIFLMISGAYQALSFTLFYLLLALFFYFIINAIRSKNLKEIISILKMNLFLFLLVLVLSLPLVFAAFDILTSVERLGSGVNLNQTLSHGLNIKSAISFLIPFSTIKNGDFFGGVDVSMRNHYFGLVPLIFLITAILKKHSTLEYLFLIFGSIIFAASFKILPVRELMFRYIPFMNLFKYAAYIKIFGLLVFILISANYITYFQENINKEKKKVVIIIIIFLVTFLFLLAYSKIKILYENSENVLNLSNLSRSIKNLSFNQHVLIQTLFQLFICVAFLLIIIFYNRIRYPLNWLIILFFVEIFTSTQLNMSSTVTDNAHKPYTMDKDLSLFPKKFPIPLDCKIIYNNKSNAAFPPFWRNTYIFSKQISFDAFSSFELDSFNKLDDDYHNLRDAVLNNHLFYFSDKIFPLDKFADSLIDIKSSSKYLYLSQEDFTNLSEKKVSTNISDKTKILKFSPNEVVVETNTANDQFLTMIQTNFKGWKTFIDDKQTTIYTSNFNYRTIFLPAGDHTVRYQYTNKKILILYIISNSLFFLIILYLIMHFLKEKSNDKLYILIPVLLLLITGFYLFKRLSYNDQNLNVSEIYNNRWSDKESLFQFRQDFKNEAQKIDSLISFTGKKSKIIDSTEEYFRLCDIPITTKKMKKGTMVVSIQIFPESYAEGLIVSDVTDNKDSEKWHALMIERQIENPDKWNEIFYLRNFYDLEEGNIINLYLWNLNHKKFKIDNINVDFYPF